MPHNPFSHVGFSPYLVFSSQKWAKFRGHMPLTLNKQEVEALRSLGDPISLREVEKIYLPLSRLLLSHVESAQNLYAKRQKFLATNKPKTPFILGIAGSVAVGKSTLARLLQLLLSRATAAPKTALLTTDGFLFSNKQLEKKNLMQHKGFPESFRKRKLLEFLAAIKTGKKKIKAPIYSHLLYDIVPNKYEIIDRPDILIVEGINVLQVSDLPEGGDSIPFISDYFDFSIYLDSEPENLRQWYIKRFLSLQKTAFQNKKSFFHHYANLPKNKARKIADDLWHTINLENLQKNILPTRLRADVVLHKSKNHNVDWVALKKI